jgi:ATP-dependent helicase/nuclease subunit B
MSLSLIVGPPNSGRAGAVLDGFVNALGREPVLVVPTADHAARFERELAEREPGVLGGSVATFARLFREIADACGAEAPPELTGHQRLRLVREAVATTPPRILAESARRPGFAPALEALIGELQAARREPREVALAAQDLGDDAYLAELGDLYAGYIAARDRLGYGDPHLTAARAIDAVGMRSVGWRERPVFIYGFDDMTGEQLAAVDALRSICETTIAVTFDDRQALSERARLLVQLRDLDPDDERVLPASDQHTDSALLRHLEREIFEPHERPAHAPDDGVVVLEAAGERTEAEQVAGEIAGLLSEGVQADSIAIVLRDPQRQGRLYSEVLDSYAIAAAVDVRVPFTRTATGRAMIALLRAALLNGRAEDFMAFMRLPGRTSIRNADWLERTVLRRRLQNAKDVMALDEKPRWETEKLRAAAREGSLAAAAAEVLADLAEYPWKREARINPADERLELRSAASARKLIVELAALEDIALGPTELIAALEDEAVWLSPGEAEGCVRVLDPYRVRANRFSHVFVCSLQEGEFPRAYASDPFLSDEQRGALGLPARATPEQEERYLFHACLSRPTHRLYLSSCGLDEEGMARERSSFIDACAALIEAPAEGKDPLVPITRSRGPGDIVFEPGRAPSEVEISRSLAVEVGQGVEPEAALAALELAPDSQVRVEARLKAGVEAASAPLPGPLRVEPVVAELGNRTLFGASTIEGYLECSYRWFVSHELRPSPLAPTPEPLDQGSVVHAVLERLYRDPPDKVGVPRPTTVDAWQEAAHALLDQEAPERGLAPRDATTRAGYARMTGLIDAFLIREAASDSPLRPDRELLEASFGEDEDDARGPLELAEGVRLHGKIDRVDIARTEQGERVGLVSDYKLSRSVTAYAKFAEEAKLQLLLYPLALERLWGDRPAGGLYLPLAATDDPRGRGVLDESLMEQLDGVALVKTDRLPAEEFRAALEAAAAQAVTLAEGMKRGIIRRNPIGDQCPRYCTFQAICRRERGAAPEPEPDEELEE